MDWLMNNQMILVGMIAGLFAIVGGVVKLTKNKTDDKWYAVALGWWNKLLSVLGKRPPTQ